jgi:hypothetical protein
MRSTLLKLLTCSLLATYASISFLGQGLHSLVPDDGHHHGASVVISSAHSDDQDTHDNRTHVVATTSDVDAHDCPICEFLAHAVSQPPQISTPFELQVLVAELTCPAQAFYSPISVGLHAPRGPPQLLA